MLIVILRKYHLQSAFKKIVLFSPEKCSILNLFFIDSEPNSILITAFGVRQLK